MMQPISNGLARNTVWMLLGQVARLLIQAFYFVLMARHLGSTQYGSFVAVVAVAAIIAPFIGNGCNNLMIKHVARDRAVLPDYFGASLAITLASGLFVSLLAVPACFFLLPRTIAPSVVAMIAGSELIAGPISNVAALAFWSLERLNWTAFLTTFASLTRLAGIAAIIALHRPTLTAWATAYAIASAVSCIVAVGCAVERLGMPKLGLYRLKGQLLQGFYFSTGFSAQTIYNDIDKVMLARMATLDATGTYAAAYRLIDVAFIPVRSVLAAAYPGFFRAGASGLAKSVAFAKGLMPRAIGYSLLVALVLLAAAPQVPKILGSEYARTAEALRWLALLPFLKTCHYFAADSLSGAGYQGLRTLVQTLVALFNVVVNLWIIPAYSWRGAAWSSLASDLLLAGMLWSCCWLQYRKQATPQLQEANA